MTKTKEKARENRTKEPQVKQTALLVNPVYTGQGRGGEKTYKMASQN